MTDKPNGEDPTAPDFSGVPLSLEQWRKRQLPTRDYLLGSVFTTTSRAILSATTGIGKTHLGVAIGMHMAAGRNFCHWKAHRPARVLVIDGEMPSELVQERLADAERRLGQRPEGFFCLCKEDVEAMPPLDTMDGDGNMVGQQYLEYLIGHLGGIDFMILDNLGCLTIGDLASTESWLPMVPYMRHLTREPVGQFWVNHTGIDKTRDYGTSTRLWQMDVAMLATEIENHPADIAFKLTFTKARLRTPTNRADYEPVNVVLENDQWSTSIAQLKKRVTYGKNQKITMEGFDFVLSTHGKPSPGLSGMPSNGLVVDFEIFRKHVMAKMPQDTDRRRSGAFKEAFESLTGPGGPIGKYGEYIWKTTP
jgi:AAA domain